MLRRIRTILALVVFVLITLLFLDVTGTLHRYFGWLASIQFWPALLALHVGVVALLVVLTLVFGRIYCSVICPLGVMQDVISRLHGIRKKNRFSYSKEKRWLRYGVLVVFVASALAGVNAVVSLLAPYSSYGRIASSLMKPVYEAGNNVLAAIAEHFDSYAFYSVDVWMRSLPTLIVASVTLVVIAVLAWRGGRTYCNTVCPVGTILSFLARFSWLKVRIDGSKCVNCGLCTKNCKASAIDFKNHKIDYSRCVVCGDCIDKCNKGAIRLSHSLPRRDEQRQASQSSPTGGVEGAGRRSFLLGLAVASTAARGSLRSRLPALCRRSTSPSTARPASSAFQLVPTVCCVHRPVCQRSCSQRCLTSADIAARSAPSAARFVLREQSNLSHGRRSRLCK